MLRRHMLITTVWMATLFFWAMPALAEIIVDTAWVRRYNGPANGYDGGGVIAVDDSGNVGVTGSSIGIGTSFDFVAMKYYPDGDTIWVRRYDGPSNGEDVAWAMAMDGPGNVHVTGYSMGDGTNWDILTIKYLTNGDAAWIRRYSSSGSQEDVGFAIAVGNSGNVYVAGRREGVYPDYVTIKYDSNGSMQWDRTYNGPGNYYDEVWAMAVDSYDNVYVTGRSYGSGSNPDFATIKYYSDGATAWVRRYNGPANKDDAGGAIAVDDAGNVYVNGLSGTGTGVYDYATIKYYPNGDTAWVRRHQGPVTSWGIASDMTIDDSGNVYVTGWIDAGAAGTDRVTLKYTPDGDTAWVRTRDAAGGAHAIAVDSSGGVYVTVHTSTMKYNADGDLLWIGPWGGMDIALDDFGHVYLTGTHSNDCLTVKYWQDSSPTVVAPDSSKFFCEPDTLRFQVTATDPDAGDTLTLSGPGIPTPITGLSPLSVNVGIHVTSPGIQDYIYTATDKFGITGEDTATYVITMNSPPDPFSLLSPPDSSFIPYDVDFDWETATDPDSLDQIIYDLYVGTSLGFHPDSTVIYNSLVSSEYTDSLGIARYYWKVLAYDICGETWASQTWTLLSAIRGDVNADSRLSLPDVIHLVNYLFRGGPAPIPEPLVGDVNCDGTVNIGDVVYLINYLFKGGPPPCEP